MGENFLEEQVKHFEKRRRIAHDDAKRPSFFERPEIIDTIYTVHIANGAELKPGETYLAAAAPDGERIDVAEGNRVVGRIEGDGAKSLAKALAERGTAGAVPIRVSEVSALSGCGKAVIIKGE